MQIHSDYRMDHATPDKEPGGYEWWYFDGIDPDSGFSFVIIFYEGNPFSNRYIRSMQGDGREGAAPENFPAVSISIYKDGRTVYYSFTEFGTSDALFDQDHPHVQVGGHGFQLDHAEGELRYKLRLSEILPSGERIEARLEFLSPDFGVRFDGTGTPQSTQAEGHSWNLVQPYAVVEGGIEIFEDVKQVHDISFSGAGYHDHNSGQEPMKNEFTDWYWGRFHFPDVTLVYYVMNRKREVQHRAWLVDSENRNGVTEFREAELNDKSYSLFGLNPAHQLKLHNEDSKVLVQQNRLLDNGPFYRRYLSEAFLHLDGEAVQKTCGISEYIYPGRIYWKVFWPFVDMRIRYKREEPHWVQKSRRLYRWTW